MKSDELLQLIRKRRNIKPALFSDKKIDETLITDILEAANWAPTHGYTEPWRFVVFSGEALRDLGAFQANLYKEKTAEADFQQKKYDKLQKVPQMASHCVVAVCKRGPKENIFRDM